MIYMEEIIEHRDADEDFGFSEDDNESYISTEYTEEEKEKYRKLFEERRIMYGNGTPEMEEKIRKEQEYIDNLNIDKPIIFKGVLVKKIGEIKNLITSEEDCESLWERISDDDYHHIYRWYLRKILFPINNDTNSIA